MQEQMAAGLREYGAMQDRPAYMAYAEACMMAGRQPLTFPEWVKAGKPAK